MRDKLGRFVKGHRSSPTTEFKKGQHSSLTTEYKKGHKPTHGFKKGVYQGYGFKKGHQMNKGSENPMWKGGRIKHIGGYVFIKKPNHPFCSSKGYVFEHRLVVEQQIGRYLRPKEVPHHLGATDDNRPHMLMAFSSNAVHRKFHGNPASVKPSKIVFDGRLITDI